MVQEKSTTRGTTEDSPKWHSVQPLTDTSVSAHSGLGVGVYYRWIGKKRSLPYLGKKSNG